VTDSSKVKGLIFSTFIAALILAAPTHGWAAYVCKPNELLQLLIQEVDGGSDSLEFKLHRAQVGKLKVAGATQAVTAQNIQALFSHEYREGLRGAKALGYIDTRGQFNIFFWKTGDDRVETGVHHRDALAALLLREAERLESNHYLEQSTALSNERVQANIPVALLKRSQGYQLTAQPVRGTMKVTYIDIDSSITGAQDSAGININVRGTAIMISKVYQAIDPSVRAVSAIRVKNSDKMNSLLPELRAELRKLGIDVPIQVLTGKRN
jgi:hypothetical protein